MKKLTLLIALIVAVTIGGVYATWTYTGTNDVVDVFTELVVALDSVTLTGEPGAYKITTNIKTISLGEMGTKAENDGDDNTVFHTAELAYTTSDSAAPTITVTFTPTDGASQTIKDNAVPSTFYFTTTTEMQFNENGNTGSATMVDIFKFGRTAADPHDITWTDNNDGTFSVTIDPTEHISINNFVLDTKAKHDAFAAKLVGNIKLVVSDGTTT